MSSDGKSFYGLKFDGASPNLAQYSACRLKPGVEGYGEQCAAANDACAGLLTETVTRDGQHASLQITGEAFAIAGAAFDVNLPLVVEGTDGKVCAAGACVVDPAGANNSVTFTAKPAIYDNLGDYSIKYTSQAASAAAKVVVEGTIINFYLAMSTTPAVTTTASDILTLLSGDAEASALVTAALTGSDTGATAVTAMDATPFSRAENVFALSLEAASGEDSIIKVMLRNTTLGG